MSTATSSSAPSPTAPSSSSPLRQPGFRWYFAGQAVSQLGSSMAPVALAFAVLDASAQAGDLGLVLAARMLPLLGFMLIGGVVADRFSRRLVLVTANLGSALTQGAIAVLLLTGHYAAWAIAGLGFLNGVLGAFTFPALRGLLPELVSKDGLQRANALLGTVKNGTKVFGPALSGVLVVTAGGGMAIVLDALSYLLAAMFLARLPSSGRITAKGRWHFARDLREGWDTFRHTSWLWPITLAFCAVNLVNTGSWQVLAPQLTADLSSPVTWGLVLGVRGAGMLLSSSLLYRLTVRRFLVWGQLAITLNALPLLALGARLPVPWLIAASFVADIGSSVSAVAWDTSLQEHIPTGVLSRVAAYDDLFSYLAIPVGLLAVGPLSQSFGPYAVITVSGLLFIVIAVLPLAAPTVRELPHTASER
ncbi:MFS transporter [Streptomyces buecherae]|uniref:MFS transporter n=1 Tax=Streptomyces buecherae TaxID=2763006 RepID=UPI0027DEEFAE|nr:MFS transporter [Streptomyces buecherae]